MDFKKKEKEKIDKVQEQPPSTIPRRFSPK